METPILDIDDTPISIRTRNLVLAETVILSALLITLIWVIFSSEIYLIEILPVLIGPGGYTILWRYRSIKYEKVNQKGELQSGLTIFLFLWSFLESLVLIPTSFLLFLESISSNFSMIKIVHVSPFLVTATFAFYLIKSFALSMKIDVKKPSIASRKSNEPTI